MTNRHNKGTHKYYSTNYFYTYHFGDLAGKSFINSISTKLPIEADTITSNALASSATVLNAFCKKGI